ncbi:hypothetical protein EBZ38_02895 [bacterium]|nr:hypothetical protein [bacterium]
MSIYEQSGISLFDPRLIKGNYQAYEQQTFLGASITSFNVSAGFGDSSSTLSLQLVEDEYNTSDGTSAGIGQDVYHSGIKDHFAPPPVGSPVFFTFGNKRVPVSDVFQKAYDDLYGLSGVPTSTSGYYHFSFGGILQSYTQNKNSTGGLTYSVQVVDPREILSNVQIILNNYAGSTYGGMNLINVYGFLEFNSALYDSMFAASGFSLSKIQYSDGSYDFRGTDLYYTSGTLPSSGLRGGSSYLDFYNDSLKFLSTSGVASSSPPASGGLPNKFPITGTGRSRRCPQGIPYYRIVQAINAMSGFNGELPDEYKNAGFNGYINFRGLNYVVDLSDLPPLPQFYFIDFDQINVLDFCLEICDVTNRELFVSLLPVINHPACSMLYAYNNNCITSGQKEKMIVGVIKVSVIDKSKPPSLTAIKNYIDNLQIPVENRDVGYELANTTTDKFIVGAQEVDMYYFTSNADRNKLAQRQCGYNKWTLEASYAQQILPYYGLLHNRAVTIPKGFGSYQQILLDSSSVRANGVGNYYVATELELRAALISFERWSEFLLQYNDVYMESVEENDIRDIMAINSTSTEAQGESQPMEISDNYKVTVPRSVWTSDENTYIGSGIDAVPKSACNPPYGYPLYYRRATQIGLPQAGLANLASIGTKLFTQLTAIRKTGNDAEYNGVINSIIKDLNNSTAGKTAAEKQFIDFINNAIAAGSGNTIAIAEKMSNQIGPFIASAQRKAKKNNQNAQRVYAFVKNVAEECLGKKFLVKIPKKINPNFQQSITTRDSGVNTEITHGPFGFKPRYVSQNPIPSGSISGLPSESGMCEYYLSSGTDLYYGALKTNFNPITEQYEYNYTPENQGGFHSFDLLQSYLGQNYGVNFGLIPIDLTNFTNENSRISAYVRFDNSEQLSFDGINSDSFTQQTKTAGYYVPDISYQMENSSFSKDRFDPSSLDLEPSGTIAFVKCEVSEKLYMPPKSIVPSGLEVHGRETTLTKVVSPPRRIYENGNLKNSMTYFQRNYKPIPPSSGFFVNDVKIFDIPSFTTTTFTSSGNVSIVDTHYPLDSGNVYALITLPGRIVPTVTSRYRDSLKDKVCIGNLKHFLLLDTVQGVNGFESPEIASTSGEANVHSRVSPNGLGADAEAAITKTFEDFTFSLPNKISAASPSPVYPDLVAIPLMSRERCYGPWLSSYIATQRVGGKIEFVKDENLSPWNYNGFDLMDQVGKLHASFGSSPLLTSERGGFVVPAAPSGIAIGKMLQNAGPLVTNISVDVSQAGIKTTFKMDLYTASFGKMQKQKLDNMSNISRNRQKQRDEINASIRKGIGKGQTNINYSQMYKKIENSMRFTTGDTDIVKGGIAASPADTALLSTVSAKGNGWTVAEGSGITAGTNSVITNRHVEASYMSSMAIPEAMDILGHNSKQFAYQFYNTASYSLSEEKAPASFEEHPNMSQIAQNKIDFIDKSNKVDGFDTSVFSSWS